MTTYIWTDAWNMHLKITFYAVSANEFIAFTFEEVFQNVVCVEYDFFALALVLQKHLRYLLCIFLLLYVSVFLFVSFPFL